MLKNLCKEEGLDTPPTLKFQGTVKLHGDNTAVVHRYGDHATSYQSRTRMITSQKDNKGFADYAMQPKQAAVFNFIFDKVKELTEPDTHSVAIFGEWCGKGIQKNVAISELAPRFVVFNIAVYNDLNEHYWLGTETVHQLVTHSRGQADFEALPVYSSEDFYTKEMTINFSDQVSLAKASTELAQITSSVEETCPVAARFGVQGIGEGMVWKCQSEPGSPFHSLFFKVKGQKHSETKVTTLAQVDTALYSHIAQFIDSVVTENRLSALYGKLHEQGIKASKESVGQFMNSVKRDIFSEEINAINKNKLDHKTVASRVSEKATQWFLRRMDAQY